MAAGWRGTCEEMGVNARTFQRWVARGEDPVRADGRTTTERLAEAEQQQIREVANNEEFSRPQPSMADRGVYFESESSSYRVVQMYRCFAGRLAKQLSGNYCMNLMNVMESLDTPISGWAAFTESWRCRKAATPVLPIRHGIKPALLFGEPVDQHIEEQPDLGAYLTPMGVERDDLQLLCSVIGQQRHQRTGGEKV